MDVTIRKVEIGDLEDISNIELMCFPVEEAATKASLRKRIETFPDSFFIAEHEGKIIGFVNGCITNDTVIHDDLFADSSLHIQDGQYQTIFGLDVIPVYRNRGIGIQLMNFMIESAKKAGRKGVILTCKDDLIPYYSKFGFVNKGVSNSVHGGAQWYDMILEF